MENVVVRFAPSPTGVLHIGSVRTAFFNWLYAKHNGGKFILRVEDTDKMRSTDENTQLIFDVMKWLGLSYDEVFIQSARIERHKEVAQKLVEEGKAYYCYCTQEELEQKKAQALEDGVSYKYDRKCRDGVPENADSADPVIRIKCPLEGATSVNDLVQGEVQVDNGQLDDFVLLRSDGTPTYMLSVVVDDHDMGVTHVVRGDDHLTNTFRQIQIYRACGWDIPVYAHIPLIYGDDGTKLSKRHGAVSAVEYQNLGYLPEALLNYLLRLGWSHGNDEIISVEQAIEWFNFDNVGKSPARFDLNKLNNVNSHYIRNTANDELYLRLESFFEREIDDEHKNIILAGMRSLKERAVTLVDLAEAAILYAYGPTQYTEECIKYHDEEHLTLTGEYLKYISGNENYDEEALLMMARTFAKEHDTKLVEIAQCLRCALVGKLASPSVFEIMQNIGCTAVEKRFNDYRNWDGYSRN